MARERAVEAGVGDRIDFEAASRPAVAGPGYDLVTDFDALHDMGDPVGAPGGCTTCSPTTAPG